MKTRGLLSRASLFSSIFTVFLVFMIVIGCAPKLKMIDKMREAYHRDQYEELIGYEFECAEKRPECVEINALKASAYANLRNYDEAVKYADRALAAIGTEYRNQDVALAYIVKGMIAIIDAKELERQERRGALTKAEKALKKALDYDQDVSKTGRAQQRANAIAANKFLCECYFMQWQISKQAEMAQKLKEIAKILKGINPNSSIGDYYFIRAMLSFLQFEINEVNSEDEEKVYLMKKKLQLLSEYAEKIHNELPEADYMNHKDANLTLQKDIEIFEEAIGSIGMAPFDKITYTFMETVDNSIYLLLVSWNMESVDACEILQWELLHNTEKIDTGKKLETRNISEIEIPLRNDYPDGVYSLHIWCWSGGKDVDRTAITFKKVNDRWLKRDTIK